MHLKQLLDNYKPAKKEIYFLIDLSLPEAALDKVMRLRESII